MSIVYEKEYPWGEVRVDTIDQNEKYYRAKIDFTEIDREELDSISHPEARLRWLASRSLLKEMSKQYRQLEVEKKENGKPHFLNLEAQFSISHSDDKVAVIFSYSKHVSVDIETYDDKIIRIKRKYLNERDFEQEDNLENLTLIWSAKESIYKYYEDSRLAYFKDEITITKKNTSTLDFDIPIHKPHSQTMAYQGFESFVLTYMY